MGPDTSAHGSDDEATTDGRSRSTATTREVLAGSATVGVGSLAGCTATDEEESTPVPGTADYRQTVDQPQAADQWTGDVDAGGHELTNLGQLNTAIHVNEGESLNAVIDDADGPAHIVLPEGEVTYDDPISNPSDDLVVVGPGKDLCTVRADGIDRFVQVYNDEPDVDLHFEGFTLDVNAVPSDGEIVFLNGSLSSLHFLDVRITNVTYEEGADRSVGLVHVVGETAIDTVTFRDGFEVDYTTFGDPNDTIQQYVLRSQSDGRIHRLVVDDTVHVEGDHFHDTVEGARCRGFAARLTGPAYIGGTYNRVDNYAAQAYLHAPEAVANVAGIATNVGHGDVFEIRGPAGVGRFSCTVGGHDPDREGNPDRGVIVKDSPDQIHLDDVTVSNVLVGMEIFGEPDLVTGTASFHNIGHSEPEGRPAVLIRNRTGRMGKAHLTVNVLNDDPDVYLDPAIEIRDNSGDGFRDGTMVIEGTVEGYEETLVDDGTGTGTTVETSRLFDDGPA